MKISFLCFDLSDNALSRAALLAQALSRHFEVELVGPCKGKDIWYPLREAGLNLKRFQWKRYPAYAFTVNEMLRAIDGDVLFACKLRPSSFGIGLLKKMRTGRPLIVDIDDWELGFFYHSGFWGRLGRFLNLSNPNGLPYTWAMERLTGFADAVTVSNRFLQNRFGGDLIYHCRDTSVLDPGRFDSLKIKQDLGLENKKVVMFLGTPRSHKGVDDLLQAMALVQHPEAHLVFVGADTWMGRPEPLNEKIKDRVTLLPGIPFDELGRTLAAADILAIPQRRTTDTQGQIPAKLFDAMAMAKPIVSTRVSDIPEVLGDTGYLVEPGNVRQLAQTIDHILDYYEEARAKGLRARERCVQYYDLKILEDRLVKIVERVAGARR